MGSILSWLCRTFLARQRAAVWVFVRMTEAGPAYVRVTLNDPTPEDVREVRAAADVFVRSGWEILSAPKGQRGAS